MFRRSGGGRPLAGAAVLFIACLSFFWGAYSYKHNRQPWPLLRVVRDALGLASSASPSVPAGRFRAPPAVAQEAELERLQALGYVQGSRPAPNASGVTLYVEDAVHPGLNLETDGHRPEARLRDMEGRVLHRWQMPYEEAFPNAPPSPAEGRHYWRRVRLLPGGELLAIYEGQGMVKLDRESELVWANDELAHHDMDVAPDGTILVLTRRAEMLKRRGQSHPVLHDFITILDEAGEVKRQISLLKALEKSIYAGFLSGRKLAGDIFHTNTLELVDGRLARAFSPFRTGTALVSLCKLDLIGVVDLESEKFTWAMAGPWNCPHQPTLLDNGHVLLLDNAAPGPSRVIELDPATQAIAWLYDGREHGFFTPTCGSNQRLPNGNTLITESDGGRAFEVTPEGHKVWELVTPHRAGENDELIATLFEVVRLSPETVSDWLDL